MSSGIIDVIKSAAVKAYEASNPVQMLYGTVTSVNPLTLKINSTLILTDEFLVLNGTVAEGDEVLVIKQQGGQKYIIMGNRTETVTEYVETGGETSSSNANVSSYGFICPLKDYTRISSYYGKRVAPKTGASTMHKGVDFAAPAGTKIYAAKAGTVLQTQSIKTGYGNSVKIQHDGGFTTLYGHMQKYIVKYGQKVSRGQLIGYVGSTGTSTGNHLHLGLYKSGGLVNPLLYIPSKYS